jgi:hypothetical protein
MKNYCVGGAKKEDENRKITDEDIESLLSTCKGCYEKVYKFFAPTECLQHEACCRYHEVKLLSSHGNSFILMLGSFSKEIYI